MIYNDIELINGAVASHKTHLEKSPVSPIIVDDVQSQIFGGSWRYKIIENY